MRRSIKSIITYTAQNRVFVIGLGAPDGIITEQVKQNLFRRLVNNDNRIYFFSIFEDNKNFQMFSDRIARGSYVWIASQPEHTIHFDDKPKLKARS